MDGSSSGDGSGGEVESNGVAERERLVYIGGRAKRLDVAVDDDEGGGRGRTVNSYLFRFRDSVTASWHGCLHCPLILLGNLRLKIYSLFIIACHYLSFNSFIRNNEVVDSHTQ
jgi:hypothetical protein